MSICGPRKSQTTYTYKLLQYHSMNNIYKLITSLIQVHRNIANDIITRIRRTTNAPSHWDTDWWYTLLKSPGHLLGTPQSLLHLVPIRDFWWTTTSVTSPYSASITMGDARLKGLTRVKAVNILVDHILFNFWVANLVKEPIPLCRVIININIRDISQPSTYLAIQKGSRPLVSVSMTDISVWLNSAECVHFHLESWFPFAQGLSTP